MDLTIKDLEYLANNANKGLYDLMYDLIIKEIENALKYTNLSDMTEEKQKTVGTCGVYFSSMVEMLHTIREMMNKGHVESGGTIAAACWERALTLRKIMIDPMVNSQIHVEHRKAKSTPWSVWKMVCDVLAHERVVKNIPAKRPFEEENFYIQYTFLSSIKHGNPYTISYLNRPGYSSDEKLFRLKSNDSVEDKDLIFYIKMLAADNALDALIDYGKAFRTQQKTVVELRGVIDSLIGRVELTVPPIMLTTPQEMGQAYWDHLIELEKQRRF